MIVVAIALTADCRLEASQYMKKACVIRLFLVRVLPERSRCYQIKISIRDWDHRGRREQ
jgi:hypothetical protein